MPSVKNWIGKEIKIPQQYFTILGKDSIKKLATPSYTIINFVDSTNCVSCKMQTIEWNMFLKEIQLYSSNVSILTYVQPKNVEEINFLKWQIRGNDFRYPVCFDIDAKIQKENNLPLDENFHTLLLDAHRKILLVGSPINNPVIKELYIRILSKK